MDRNQCHDSRSGRNAVVDPFADDLFWDSWSTPNTPPPCLDIGNDEELQQHEQFCGCEFDWGTSVSWQHAEVEAK